ncbi:MAG: hypothetical protein V3R79_09725, partial [Alphaproteobacteria bacterium]
TDRQRQILSFFIKQQEFGRPYVAPPDVPKDRVKILRVALKKTWASPGFLSDAKKLRLDVDPISGPQVEKLVKELYALPKELVAEIVATTKKPRKKKKKKKKKM